MFYFVMGFALLGRPNLQFRVEKSMQTVKYLTAYAIGCGVLSFMILLMWLF